MSECIGCGAAIGCDEIGPYDLYSLEGLPFSLILACPAGIDCQHADEIRIVCCKQELFVRIPANATASDRIKLIQDLLQECYRREAFCKGGGCPPGQDCVECPEGIDCSDPCALFIVPRPPNCGPITLYFNKPQTCTIKCPDGLPFSYTIKGGLYLALTQVLADTLAFKRACVLAMEHRICLRAASGIGCIGNSSEMRIYAFGNIYTNGVPTLFWDVVTGLASLPPGMTLDQTAIAPYVLITGTPTTAGTYTFEISATHAFTGDHQSRSYTITVFGISTSSLPDGESGEDYSETLTTTGLTAPLIFSISNGALPDGLSLDASTGEISGTPTEDGDFTFTVQVADSAGHVCSKEYTISIEAPVTAANLYWPFYILTTSTPEIVGPFASRDLTKLGSSAVINDGIIDKAIRLDSGASFTRNFTSSVSPISSFKSARFWVRFNESAAIDYISTLNTGTAHKMFITISNDDRTNPGTPLPDFYLWLRSSGGLVFGHKHPTPITPGPWHHIVWTYDTAAQIASLYLDTVKDDFSVNYNPYPTSGTFVMSNSGSAPMPEVDLCELAMWGTHILTQDEVDSDYNGGAGKTWPW